jgi:hypothetical protein
MKCLRSGYCCVQYVVPIVIDPALGPVEGNLRVKETGERCPHLTGSEPGQHACAVHDEPWYPESPCAAFTQIESGDTPCRVGTHVMKGIPATIL